MKPYLAFFAFLFCAVTGNGQSLTGIWRGSFYSARDLVTGGSKYRYEVQINDNKKMLHNMKGVRGVTYSYQNTRFFGKSPFEGVWTPGTKNLVLRETKMDELRIEGGGDGCLMTCYLEYRTEGGQEYLEGTYTSSNMTTGADCGAGKVTLERVTESDFEEEEFLTNPVEVPGKVKPGQEDFLVKKPAPAGLPAKKEIKPESQKKAPTAPVVARKITPTPEKKPVTPPVVVKAKPLTPTVKEKPALPPVSAKAKPVKMTPPLPRKSKGEPVEIKINETAQPQEMAPDVAASNPVKTAIVLPPPPAVLKGRSNELFETIETASKELTISFYDNGDIDGDTISVYDNGRLIAVNRGLSTQPILIKLNVDDKEPVHELVMVAENMGRIPPNTALMIVEAGEKRYNVRLSSTEQKNAMVRFRFVPTYPK